MTKAYVTSSQDGNLFLTWGFLISSANEALLHRGGHQFSLLGVHVAHGQPASAARRRGLLREQQPPVGAARPVEPHRVVQARPGRPAGPPAPPLPPAPRVPPR